jgi:predicted transposase/invertase (TIGR01784 family)
MLLAEYNYDTDIAVQRREAFDDGVMQGLSRGISQGLNEGIAIGEERGISIGLSQGITQGEHKKAVETAKSMKLENMPISMIAHFTGLSPEEIEKL